MLVQWIDSMGTDLSVVNAARVSFGKKKETYDEGDRKLINYLARHSHTSPFGHCFATFHISAPLFVARQLVKHKFLRWNEISRRYVDEAPKFYYPEKWRLRSSDKKQGSSSKEISNSQAGPYYSQRATSEALYDYNKLLEEGVCPEQARMILPQNMYTEWYWSGSLDAWADMCNLRTKSDTQYETQYIAKNIADHCSLLWPDSFHALTGWIPE